MQAHLRFLTLLAAALLVPAATAIAGYATIDGTPVTQGQLRVASSDLHEIRSVQPAESSDAQPEVQRVAPTGQFVLEKTEVDVEISGVLARVRLEQVFKNPYADRLEAVYVFPLPENAAVDGYSFQIGELVIDGVVKKREEARREYENARDEGRKAALLEEERANIFTQSVANIPPGETISVRIEYVHPVKMKGSNYQFRFPMVVAPRYIPGGAVARPSLGRGWANDTDQTPDASRVTPPVLPKGMRHGNDIFLTMRIDGGVPVQKVTPVTHEIDVETKSETNTIVKLRAGSTIPNKDFVLEYSLAGEQISLATLVHRVDESNPGYVSVVLQPKRDVTIAEIVPREVIFLLDTSGSMNGTSISQMRIVAQNILSALNPQDTFRVVSFNSRAYEMDRSALPATPENLDRGKDFIRGLRAGSGTELLPALRTALGTNVDESSQPRYLILVTDALVGNDDSILGYLQHDLFERVRIFPIAIGGAPNHYLIERAAEIGRGFSMHVTNQDNATEMAKRFTKKVAAPILTDLELDWGGLAVKNVLPNPLPDLHAGEPLVVLAQFEKAGKAEVTLRSNLAGKAVETKLEVALPEKELAHDSLRAVWARKKVRQIWNRNVGRETTESREAITRLGLDHQIVTRYTSFIAVEREAPAKVDGKLRTADVPSMLPEGMTEQAAPGKAFRQPQHQPRKQNARPRQRVTTPPANNNPRIVSNTPAPSRPAPQAPPRTRNDPGLRMPRFGGGGGGCVEWIFLGSAALLGAGRVTSRRKRPGDNEDGGDSART